MGFLDKLLSKERWGVGLVTLIALANLLVFWQMFGFHENNDTDSYITAINFFRGAPGGEMYPNRYLNPFYSVIGATLLRFVEPATSIIILNIAFYFGMVLLTYGLIRRVFESRLVGLISATILMTGYPLLRYGLTQVQDIGGYFWFVLVLYSGWRWYEDKKSAWLILGSVAISGGLLTKESGAMGALFFGALILLSALSLKEKAKKLAIVSSLAFVTLVINQWRGQEIGYSSLRWLLDNWVVYADSNYTFFKWVGVNATTYNLAWLLVLVAVVALLKKKITLSANAKTYFLAVVVPSLSYFAWPLFIGRTVFISAWLIVPVAALGIEYVLRRQVVLGYIVWALVLVSPYALQNTLRYAHVFHIWDICHKDISCSWNYFWDNRHTFSETM
jgi:4-amino-4-deoxy-L-arabinose transferase-like glycosyltransferase